MPARGGVDPELWEVMPSTITWEAVTGRDAWGHFTYAAPELIDHCNVSFKLEEVLSADGTETIKAGTVIIGTTKTLSGKVIQIGINDRITLPDGVTHPRILMANSLDDETGAVHHIVVNIGLPGGG